MYRRPDSQVDKNIKAMLSLTLERKNAEAKMDDSVDDMVYREKKRPNV